MHHSIAKILKDYPITTDIPLRWSDMDALQHVNNTVYLRYFESARIVYFNRVGLIDHRQQHGIGPILHSVYCRFRIPLTFPDMVTVGIRARNLQHDRFGMETSIVSHNHEKVAAEGHCIIVCYNYQIQSKASIPEIMRQRLVEIEGEALLHE